MRCGSWSAFFSAGSARRARGRALGLGELKFSGQVLPTVKKVVYGIDIKRVMRSKLVLGIADGWLSADGNIIYRASDLKVGLFRDERAQLQGQREAWRTLELTAKEAQTKCMRRVVVTGMGIVSSIGNNTQEVLASLREAKSGIIARGKFRRTWLSMPGSRLPHAECRRDRSIAARCGFLAAARRGIISRWSRRSAMRAWSKTRSPTIAPASSWVPAGLRHATHRRGCRHHPRPRVRSASDLSRSPRRCPRPRRRRLPPGSRSRA